MIRLFHISDLHFGLEDTRALDWVVQAVRDEAPDGVIITGDFTMRARATEYAQAARWIAALGVPVRIDPGNHDLPYFNPLERLVDPYRRFRALEASVTRPLVLPGLVIVRLPTTAAAQWRLNWSRGIARSGALARALAELDAIPLGTPVIVTCHHPLVEVGTHGRALTRGGDLALSELARRGVLAVLSGHVHDDRRGYAVATPAHHAADLQRPDVARRPPDLPPAQTRRRQRQRLRPIPVRVHPFAAVRLELPPRDRHARTL
jgi:3',5'-cyclic AMP phosphodiesterase CpdA